MVTGGVAYIVSAYSRNSYAKVLTPSTSEEDYIFGGKNLKRGNSVKMRLLEWDPNLF